MTSKPPSALTVEPLAKRQASVPSEPVKAKTDSPDVLQRLHDGLPIVEVIATQLRRQLGGRVMRDDLLSFGREGLLAASRSFDASLGVPFRRWANYRVRGAMLDGVRSQSFLPRSVYERIRALEAANVTAEGASEDGSAAPPASPEDADARLGTYLAGIATAVALGLLATSADPLAGEILDQTPSADDTLARAETLSAVREAMETLPEQERHMVQRYYFDEMQLHEAAEEIGLSKSWGSRLHARAIESMTRQLKRTKTTL